MGSCKPGRAVEARLKFKKSNVVHKYTIVVPLHWTKTEFLRFVREQHPDETVTILDWPQLGWDHVWVVPFFPEVADDG